MSPVGILITNCSIVRRIIVVIGRVIIVIVIIRLVVVVVAVAVAVG